MTRKSADAFSRVEQPRAGDNTCLVCCVSMITGVPLGRILPAVSMVMGEPLPFVEAVRFLAAHKVTLGMWATRDPGLLGLQMRCQVSRPAIVLVDNGTADTTHAVVWTGRHVLDPAPGMAGPRLMSEYRVREWWPVTRWL